MALRPDTGRLLTELTDLLLRGPSTLTRADRELIATYVSSQNGCSFCQSAHGAVAAYHLGGGEDLVCSVQADYATADIPEKLKALLSIAGKVQQGGHFVTSGDAEKARGLGATDLEIHDTVLIAAAFCMFNRYVDGLATWAPTEAAMYSGLAAQLAEEGYSCSSAAMLGESA